VPPPRCPTRRATTTRARGVSCSCGACGSSLGACFRHRRSRSLLWPTLYAGGVGHCMPSYWPFGCRSRHVGFYCNLECERLAHSAVHFSTRIDTQAMAPEHDPRTSTMLGVVGDTLRDLHRQPQRAGSVTLDSSLDRD